MQVSKRKVVFAVNGLAKYGHALVIPIPQRIREKLEKDESYKVVLEVLTDE